MRVNETLLDIQDQFNFDDEKVIKYIFDKLESERSLFWIQVARTFANRLEFEANVMSKL